MEKAKSMGLSAGTGIHALSDVLTFNILRLCPNVVREDVEVLR